LIRLLGSDRAGEVGAAVEAIKRTLDNNGLDFHALADRLTSKSTSKSDKTRADEGAYTAGYQAGQRAGWHEGFEEGQRAGLDRGRHGGRPRDGDVGGRADGGADGWREMARFCLDHKHGLNEREADFVESMVEWTADGRPPTEKQGSWLNSIFEKLKERERNHRRRPSAA
jgi:hypothetical protein